MTHSIDRNYRLLGARFLRRHAKRLAAQLDPVRLAEDVEAVHQARVASRRLRAALRMFGGCFPAESVKRWRKAIRRVTKSLGPARDLDVQILLVMNQLEQVGQPEYTRGAAVLLGELQRDRSRQQVKVLRVVKRLRRSGVLGEILDATRVSLAKAKAKALDVASPRVVRRANRYLRERFEELWRHAGGLDDPSAVDEHHAMRIAAKRLRYALEMAAPAFAGKLDEQLAAAKRLQTLLGEIHDCDVWDGRIGLFEQRMLRRTMKHFGVRGPFSSMEIGLAHLRGLCRERREDAFAELCCFWAGQPFGEIAPPRSASDVPATDACSRCEDGRDEQHETE